MVIIEQLSEYIDEELCDAKKYIKHALEVKSTYPGLAETFNQLSLEEMQHMQRLHSEVEKLISNYRKEHGEPPEAMQAVYNYLHKKSIDKAKEVRIYQSMFRE